MIANRDTYLAELWDDMAKQWPGNETINIACHGHSVPAGYFMTPVVDSLRAYPHLLKAALAERFPFSVVNVVVTSIGGEHSTEGAERFARDVMCFRPRVVTIDYGLNDRRVGLKAAEAAWRRMIETAMPSAKVVLMTPSWELSYREQNDAWKGICEHAEQARRLADEYGVALCDTFAAFERYVGDGHDMGELMSQSNHPSAFGHELILRELKRWFFP